MASPPSSSLVSSQEILLPPGFESLRQIRDMENQRLKTGPLVSVIGFVKDYQPPRQTQRDMKCTIELIDHSLQNDLHGLKVNMFYNKEKMPIFDGPGDVVLIRKIKVQFRDGGVSLLSNVASEVHVLLKLKLPVPIPKSGAPWISTPPIASTKPKETEIDYINLAVNQIGDLDLPSKQEFQDMSERAMNVKDKYSLLKDVEPDTYHDIIAEVVKTHDSGGIHMTAYVSDYSVNSKFYNYEWRRQVGDEVNNCRDGDEYGYLKSKKNMQKEKDWPGPFGQMTIQLTVYDAHADFIREHVKLNEWVLLRNIHFKYGKTGGLLEGFLRQDRNAFEGKVQVQIMQPAEEAEDNDPRLVDGKRRKLDWTRQFKEQKKKIIEEQANAGSKRKLESEEPKKNSKQRRKERRAAAEGKIIATEVKVAKKLDLNENVRCSYPEIPTTRISDILKPCPLQMKQGGNGNYISPFSVGQYRANVRVVDYFPDKVEDFAIGRRISEFDILLDYHGDEDTDPEEDMRSFRAGKGWPKRKWEWRFALKVEDAEASESLKKEYVWLIVDNEAAQGLLGLDQDATNLRDDPSTLKDLKEQLFKLWGELEERKTALLPPTQTFSKKASGFLSQAPPSSITSTTIPSSPPEIGGMPDPDSDNEHTRELPKPKSKNAAILAEKDGNMPSKAWDDKGVQAHGNEGLKVKNKAFTCCIRQYGVKIKEVDPAKANAGEVERWERRFGMFGTVIV